MHIRVCRLQVPMDQAKNALDMITRFTQKEDFGGRASAKLVSLVRSSSGVASSTSEA